MARTRERMPSRANWRTVQDGESWRHASGAWIERVGARAVYRLGQADAEIAPSLAEAFAICERWARTGTEKRPGRAPGAGP